MDDHVKPLWYANEHAVYMGADGGFSLRCCPNPEANARHIVKAVNYHDRLIQALRTVTDATYENDPDGVLIDNTFTEGADLLLSELEATND